MFQIITTVLGYLYAFTVLVLTSLVSVFSKKINKQFNKYQITFSTGMSIAASGILLFVINSMTEESYSASVTEPLLNPQARSLLLTSQDTRLNMTSVEVSKPEVLPTDVEVWGWTVLMGLLGAGQQFTFFRKYMA